MLVPIAMGAAVYGQSLPEGGLSLATWLAALALAVGGIVTLSISPPVAAIHALPTPGVSE